MPIEVRVLGVETGGSKCCSIFNHVLVAEIGEVTLVNISRVSTQTTTYGRRAQQHSVAATIVTHR